ncbi:TRAP transporter substrate-binding protein [Thalassospira sp.]|uniref:TRAP transporter substrate-binding protein n=1 Tax=Thalassospira sp. TaxID=1912094 RepID=UPI003AA90F2F
MRYPSVIKSFAACLFLVTSSQAALAETVLRLAENQPENNPVTIAMHRFAELAQEYSNGEIQIQVYAGGQFGQETETIEQTQVGIIEMTRVNAVTLANVTPSVGVFALPYIFKDTNHKYAVLDGDIGKDVRNEMAKAGLVGFDFMEAGSRSFYTREGLPLTGLEDLKGRKIRVQNSPIAIRMVELLGAIPTPMNYGEVFSSLQTGVMDGAENDFVSFLTSGHYEVAKNFLEDEHLSPPAIVVMNKETFDGLPTEQQDAISRAAHEAALYERKLMFEANAKAKQTVIDAGVTVLPVDNTPFQQAILPIYDEFPELSDYINRISEVN